jgi:hypothetical protein
MIELIFVIALAALCPSAIAQPAGKTAETTDARIPLTNARWEAPAGAVEFASYKGQTAMKLLSGENVVLKDFVFSNGTIEYDVDLLDERFTGIDFRRKDNQESETFYLRVARTGDPVAMDAIQYAPYNKGVNLWDLFDHFQGPAALKTNDWNHIKLVVSGKQMLVYVNDLVRPALQIPQLEGNTSEGTIAFNGRCAIANLVIKQGEVEGLPAREGFDPTHHDPRFIRVWQVNDPHLLPEGRELFEGAFPKLPTIWLPLQAERRGLVNITRLYGAEENGSRRYVWVRTKLISRSEQKRRISLGFSDEVWVYHNRRLIFLDKNVYTSPQMRKNPDGRISIENAKFEIALKQGENELLIGLANNFFGWGLIARLDRLDGIEVSTDFPAPVSPPANMNTYAGTYGSTEVPFKIMITATNETLMAKATGEPAIAMEYFETDKFRYEQAGLVLEFTPHEKKMVLKQGKRVIGFTRE